MLPSVKWKKRQRSGCVLTENRYTICPRARHATLWSAQGTEITPRPSLGPLERTARVTTSLAEPAPAGTGAEARRSYVHRSSVSPGLHTNRAACRNRHYCYTGGNALPGVRPGEGQSPADHLHLEREAG